MNRAPTGACAKKNRAPTGAWLCEENGVRGCPDAARLRSAECDGGRSLRSAGESLSPWRVWVNLW